MADEGLPVYRDADWSASDELIVATEHLGFVRELIGAHITLATSNRALGLTRLRISAQNAIKDLRKIIKKTPGAREVRTALRSQAAALATLRSTSAGDQVSSIATDLRALAAAQHGGWMPTLGRNRMVVFPGSDSVGVSGETSFGQARGLRGASGETSFGQVRGLLGASGETSFGRARGLLGATGETSFGGGGVPRPVSRSRRWTPPPARATGPGRGVRVGLLDTGIWPHPWLAGGWVGRPSDVLSDSGTPGPVAGHGTFVAGLILSQAPGATVEVRRVLDESGQGTAWDAAEAIADLGQSGVSVLNLSFACYTSDGQPPLALARAVDRVNADVVVVAAAGNHAALAQTAGPRSTAAQKADLAAFAALPSWPAALDDVLGVGALDRDGRPADFSPDRPWVDVAARGVDLRSTYLPQAGSSAYPMRYGAGWAEWSGTSFSAALVSGAIASGIDEGRVSGPEVVEDLLWNASVESGHGGTPQDRGARRLNLRTAGWARGSNSSSR
jgi:membrane-anchored mycosin MYCP